MIPVLGPDAIRQADAYTIAHEPIASIDLMERAASRCAERILGLVNDGRFPHEPFVLVAAGMGNNGGDGLVIARLLHRAGLPVRAVRVRHRPEASPDNEANRLRALEAGVAVRDLDGIAQWPSDRPGLIIDALFGTGLSAPLRGLPAEAVRAMNASGAPIIAIDLPSGLFAEDNTGNDPQAIVRAALTLTLELPKLCLLLAENAPFTGEWEAVPIGLLRSFIRQCPTPYRVMEPRDAAALLPARPRFAHKGSFGHALLIGGSEGRVGAMVLAARAALRSGAGLVTAAVPGCGRDVLQAAAPEAMCLPDPDPKRITALPGLEGFSSIGIGPGLSTGEAQAAALSALLGAAQAPLVLDADAINLLGAVPALRERVPQGAVLTPHPREFDRLYGSPAASGYERLQRARELAQRMGCIIVLKGAFTAICAPDGSARFNRTGNPGMAKGGSGDALTGVITALLAQGLRALEACVLGVHAHGLAGDLAARAEGMDGMTAMDLVEALPQAWAALRAEGALRPGAGSAG